MQFLNFTYYVFLVNFNLTSKIDTFLGKQYNRSLHTHTRSRVQKSTIISIKFYATLNGVEE